MKINDPNLSNVAGTQAGRTRGAERVSGADRPPGATAAVEKGDDVHLSELVRSLRALAAESPERQARLEGIARAYAQGRYHVDADATAAGIIGEAETH